MTVLAGFALAVLLSAVFSGLETGLYTTSRLRLFLDDRAGIRAAARVRALLADPPSLLSVLLVANNTANFAASYLAQVLLLEWSVGSPELVGTVGVSAVLFVFAEAVPKNAFRRRRESLLYPVLPVLAGAHRLLAVPVRPLTWLTAWLSRTVERRLRGGQGTGRGTDERQSMLAAGAAEGFLTRFQERVARGVLTMRSRRAGDAAMPLAGYPRARVGIPAIDVPAGCREHRVLVLDSTGDRVVGWMPMAALWASGRLRAPVRRELQRVTRVDAAESLDRVYVHMDRTATPFAVVGPPGRERLLDVQHLRRVVMGGAAGRPPSSVASVPERS